MTLQLILEMLKEAPTSEIDQFILDKINNVDSENETAVRELFDFIHESHLYSNVSTFVATLVDPYFTNKYPLK